MTFDNRIARIEQKRSSASGGEPKPRPQSRDSGLATLLLWAVFLALVWAALAYPLGALLAAMILGPIGAFFVIPYLLLRRNRRNAPERSAILDLINHLNPFY